MVAYPQNRSYTHSLSDLLGEWGKLRLLRHIDECSMLRAMSEWGEDTLMQGSGAYSCVEMLKRDIQFRVREWDDAPVGVKYDPKCATYQLVSACGISCIICGTVTSRTPEQRSSDADFHVYYPWKRDFVGCTRYEAAVIFRAFVGTGVVTNAELGATRNSSPLCRRCVKKYLTYRYRYEKLGLDEDYIGTIWTATQLSLVART